MKRFLSFLMLAVGLALGYVATAQAADKKPNILIIWGDDIGQFNISAYNMGMMGYKTPNIDRIAQGRRAVHRLVWPAELHRRPRRVHHRAVAHPHRPHQGRPAGRARGSDRRKTRPGRLAQAAGLCHRQFGKNHLGDRNDFLPTVHGFDEFFGNLYHLNAEEEPENRGLPEGPGVQGDVRPARRLALLRDGQGRSDRGPALRQGRQAEVEDTGPLTKKRMETVDEEVTAKARSTSWKKAQKAGKPFFVWWNSTRMHVFTHLKKESVGKTGLGIYADGMVEHDGMVGQLLDKLKELGIEDNTIVMYSTDNGAESFTWPDGGTTMFRGEKNTQWEGGCRVPCCIRWPGVIKPGTIINDICSHEDMIPTLLAAAGDTTVKEDLLKGKKVGDKTFKVHLDGYNLCPRSRAKAEWPRHEFLYWTDDGSVAALRYNNWKISFLKQNAHGLEVWQRALRGTARAHDLTICAWTRSSAPRMRAWATGSGWPTACSCSRPRAAMSRSGCRASASSRRARSPAASASTA